jgi:hypothetical protein
MDSVETKNSYRTEFVSLSLERGWRVGAELGLGTGLLLEALLMSNKAVSIIGVDHFMRQDRKSRVMSIANRYYGRCTIHSMRTSEASFLVEPESLDFVFVDASHKYGCVRNDIRLWWPKVRKGGWFGGHDYSVEYPGVLNAVNEKFGDYVSVSRSNIWSVEKR